MCCPIGEEPRTASVAPSRAAWRMASWVIGRQSHVGERRAVCRQSRCLRSGRSEGSTRWRQDRHPPCRRSGAMDCGLESDGGEDAGNRVSLLRPLTEPRCEDLAVLVERRGILDWRDLQLVAMGTSARLEI